MEHFFQYELYDDTQQDFRWFDEVAPVNQSAFVNYSENPGEGFPKEYPLKNHRNVKKRMIEFLIRTKNLVKEAHESEKERSRRHMISERMRRERQKRSYLDLHSLLPSGTKPDKNSIIIMTAKEVEELQRCKEELERKNSEIEKVLGAMEIEEQVEQAKIKISVAFPSSGIDSMLEVMKCLKQTNSKTRTIQSALSTQEFSAVFGIETKVGAAEVEQAVHRSLFEVERKFHFNFLEEEEEE